MRAADRRASVADWDGLLVLREACLAATEETGRQLWGPARYAAYRIALEGPAALAASMVEPGVVRFGLGPLTEVVAQHHTFAELAPHLDAAVLPIVAQERVLRGEDLRADDRAAGAPDDPPLVLEPFEPAYVLPAYRADARLDGAVADPAEQAGAGRGALPTPTDPASGADAFPAHADAVPAHADAVPAHADAPASARRLGRALEEVVAPWTAQSGGEARVVAVPGTTDDALRALHGTGTADVRRGPVTTAQLLALLAHAGASGGVHGRRRGGAAGRSLAWWVARCATGLADADTVEPDELEFLLEDLDRVAARSPGEAAWRLEVALGGRADGGPAQEWAVAIAAFDRSEGPVPPDAAPW